MNRRVRPGYLLAFVALVLAVIVPIVVRWATTGDDPAIEVVSGSGTSRTIGLRELEAMPRLCRRGAYQNQFGNWRDEGVYCGVRLIDLIDPAADVASVLVIAADGYRVELARARIEDEAYPVVVAFSYEGLTVPAWEDGYRIAVLPEDGAVSNADYGVDSAGSIWVKNVSRLIVQSTEGECVPASGVAATRRRAGPR